jgi:very-short-patch-repair endonuclease
VNSPVLGDPAAILDRHAVRRTTGIPTVSLVIGPIGAGGRTWRRWAAGTGRSVVLASRNGFPCAEWVRAIAERVDLPAAAVHHLAERAERDRDEFLAAWRDKTPADCERFWTSLAPETDDDLLRAAAILALGGGSPSAVAASLSDLGERIIPMIARLAPSAMWPGVLFVAGSIDDFLSVGRVAVKWAMRVPALPIAVAVPAGVWDQYVAHASESRTKALLREGEVAIPVIDAATIEHALAEAGAVGSALAAITANGADATLLELAVEAARATAVAPTTQAEADRARSAAERFLFTFLESLPETAGRFELNGALDFKFGTRSAEVDLLCRSPRIAIEVDGHFHFLVPDDYRRDRAKDWELQRRGFIVLRFLAEDVIPQLEMIRDRILDALSGDPESPGRGDRT